MVSPSPVVQQQPRRDQRILPTTQLDQVLSRVIVGWVTTVDLQEKQREDDSGTKVNQVVAIMAVLPEQIDHRILIIPSTIEVAVILPAIVVGTVDPVVREGVLAAGLQTLAGRLREWFVSLVK